MIFSLSINRFGHMVMIHLREAPIKEQNKLGCASVKLHIRLEFLKVLSDLINFGWWLTMLEIMGDHYFGAV